MNTVVRYWDCKLWRIQITQIKSLKPKCSSDSIHKGNFAQGCRPGFQWNRNFSSKCYVWWGAEEFVSKVFEVPWIGYSLICSKERVDRISGSHYFKGADPSAKDNVNEAIKITSYNGYTEIARILLAYEKFDPLEQDNTTVILATENGHHIQFKRTIGFVNQRNHFIKPALD